MSEKLKLHPEVYGKRAPCFTPAQWQVFVKAEKELAAAGKFVYPVAGFCAECTPRYKNEMMVRGRCRHPDVVFEKDEDGQLVGVRKKT